MFSVSIEFICPITRGNGPFLSSSVQLQALVEVASNDVDLMAEERTYEEQELGAKFDPTTGKRMYHNYEVLRVLPQAEEDLSVLRFLEKGDS